MAAIPMATAALPLRQNGIGGTFGFITAAMYFMIASFDMAATSPILIIWFGQITAPQSYGTVHLNTLIIRLCIITPTVPAVQVPR